MNFTKGVIFLYGNWVAGGVGHELFGGDAGDFFEGFGKILGVVKANFF